ncbi:hypothetical protein KJN74_04260 [Candidatus Bathyarchaeota archaeon]|nr:hypothetical protein [Candidatus Bathyarchaeota archaeon]
MSILAGTRDNPEGKMTLNKYVMGSLMILGLLTLPFLIIVVLDITFLTLKDLFIILSAIIIIKWLMTHIYNFTKNK